MLEGVVRQRAVVGLRIAFADGERITKYTLPFVDAAWKTAFIVLDLFGGPPMILEGPLRLDGLRLRTPTRAAELRRIESVPRERFADLVHYDPWWAFRGISGVDRPWIETIFATNIARPFRHKSRTLKVEDLEFSADFGRLLGVIAKDHAFHAIAFRPGELDLLALRRDPREGRHVSEKETAKAL